MTVTTDLSMPVFTPPGPPTQCHACGRAVPGEGRAFCSVECTVHALGVALVHGELHSSVVEPIGVRLDDQLRARLDRIATAVGERAAGARVSRSDALRACAARGAAALEHELGLDGDAPAQGDEVAHG